MIPRDDPERSAFSIARVIGILGKLDASLPVSRDEVHYVLAWREDAYAQRGIAIVGPATARIGDRVMAGEDVPLEQLQSALYEVWSGPLSRYFHPPEWQEAELEPA
jgi:hypothetical protein